MKIIGYRKAQDFVAPDTGVVHEGYDVYFSYPLDEKPNQAGFGCMAVKFVKSAVFKNFLNDCAALGVDPLGCPVECYYSRYSKPGKPKIDLIRVASDKG